MSMNLKLFPFIKKDLLYSILIGFLLFLFGVPFYPKNDWLTGIFLLTLIFLWFKKGTIHKGSNFYFLFGLIRSFSLYNFILTIVFIISSFSLLKLTDLSTSPILIICLLFDVLLYIFITKITIEAKDKNKISLNNHKKLLISTIVTYVVFFLYGTIILSII